MPESAYWHIELLLGYLAAGFLGALGAGVHCHADFALGSLQGPDQAEFDELVGSPKCFAYTDNDSGRHVFSQEVEGALRDIAVPDGITVLDKGHSRDLVRMVEEVLGLMLGPEASREVIAEAACGDLRRFLERVFFAPYLCTY